MAAQLAQVVGSSFRQIPGSGVLVPANSSVSGSQDLTNDLRIAVALATYNPTIPFGYNTPADPVTTQTIDVTAGSFSSLQSAVSTDGALVNVPAGTYSGSLSNFGDDVDIVMSNSATVNGGVALYQSSRVRWTGGNVNASGSASFDADSDDVLFDNVRIENISSGYLQGNMNRWAFINSTIISNSYAVACQQFNTDTDMIYVNNFIEGGSVSNQATVRLMSVHRGVFVGNRVRNNSNYALRVHYNMEDFHGEYNQFECLANGVWYSEEGGSANTYGPFTRLYFRNNEIHHSDSLGFAIDFSHGTTLNTTYVGNNTAYYVGGGSWTTTGNPYNDEGGNVRVQQSFNPPAYSGGADH